MSRIAIVNQSAPHGKAAGLESLDLTLAAGTFGQEVGLFFCDDGVFQLLSGQQPALIARRDYGKTFAALEFYDVEDIYVLQESLLQRGLNADDLVIDVEVIDNQAWQQKLISYQHILQF